ncbi:DNA adenine methylase [Bailinhaonella thermotolerans]|uniref:DNA adenine methylase n=1 Tax=Bailinhaonella thermotolerans TaxID=1070861 RepID=A0A3A4A324_9ACTN|nr:DNA adenine methylase [Bailinhaonella thermotolerans]
MAPHIVSLLPSHAAYVEPFAGSAAVFFAKAPVPIEVLNDVNGDLIAFLRTLRDRPGELERLIALTPYARTEHAAARLGDAAAADVERARRWWIQCMQSRSGEAGGSWRRPTHAIGSSNAHTAKRQAALMHAYADRLRDAYIECCDAVELIGRMDAPATAFYVDPPYLRQVRTPSGRYVAELEDEAGHRRLLAALSACAGTVVLSGYCSPLYEELLRGWVRLDYRVRNAASDLRRHAVESVWINR